jgi:hypothetical protein
MAFFGFSDIKFNKGTPSRNGPLAPLVSSQFEKNTFRYPLDVGNYDKAHYMVFYIREQRETQFKGTPADENALQRASEATSAGARAQIQNAISNSQAANLGANFGNQILNKVNNGLSNLNTATGGSFSGLTSAASKAIGGAVGNLNNIFGQKSIPFGGSSSSTQAVIDTSVKKITGGSLGFLRTTKLTTDAIALYMPDTLAFSYSQSYDQLALGGELGGKLMAAGKSIVDAAKGGEGTMAKMIEGGKSAFKSAALTGIQSASTLLGENTGQVLFSAAAGAVQNPMLEMIYRSPNFRQFQFDFAFYPRDEREALEVQKIIERFRFHQAPEFLKGTQGFLVPPSEFDIKFYYGGAENPNIPPVATCVLTSIDVNYAPNGFSAYEIPGENQPALGRTGMPVSIQMSLQFQEVTYLTKEDFKTFRDKSAARRNDAINGSISGGR